MIDLFFFFLPFILGGACLGIFCGLMPFWIGIKHRRPGLAFFALFSCVVCGIVLGAILAIPIAASFSVAILLSKRGQPKPVAEKEMVFASDREAEAAVEA